MLRRKLAWSLLALVCVATLVRCGGDDPAPPARRLVRHTPRSKAVTPGPDCETPARKPTPKWVPRELPLPKGTYFYRSLPVRKGFHRGRFVVPGLDARAFKRFAFARWPRAGFELPRPDSEPGEVESLLRAASGTGLFKANDVLCEPPYLTLLLIFGG